MNPVTHEETVAKLEANHLQLDVYNLVTRRIVAQKKTNSDGAEDCSPLRLFVSGVGNHFLLNEQWSRFSASEQVAAAKVSS